MARVAVVRGGASSEAEVSRVSAKAVSVALNERGHDVIELECDRTLASLLLEARVDVVFPVVHGAFGEDGCVQGLLELLSLPYVGAGVLASALANDKIAAKIAFRAAGLPVADQLVLHRSNDLASLARATVERLGTSIVVKPSTQGSALGVTLLPALEGTADERLHAALTKAFALDEAILVERFVAGHEVTCGVLDLHGDEAIALPPTKIESHRAGWYDFASRYGSGGSTHRCPAPFPDATIARIREVAVGAHRALGVRDLSRADFVVDDAGGVTLLEVNTMPGMTATSLYPEEAAVAGIPFATLCDRLVASARARGIRRINAAEPFPTSPPPLPSRERGPGG